MQLAKSLSFSISILYFVLVDIGDIVYRNGMRWSDGGKVYADNISISLADSVFTKRTRFRPVRNSLLTNCKSTCSLLTSINQEMLSVHQMQKSCKFTLEKTSDIEWTRGIQEGNNRIKICSATANNLMNINKWN